MLIATFVMAIGLLSLASLIPVGMHEVAVANRAQHAAIVGRSAWRDIKTREWLRPRSPVAPFVLWYDRQGNDASGLAVQPGAFAIDPLFISVNGTDANAGAFPYRTDATGDGSRLPRITLKLSEYDTSPILSGFLPLAEQSFISRNEPVFDPIYVPTQAKTDRPHRVLSNTNVPQIGGEYSWMMTVSPAQGEVGRLYTVSVVVFYKRVLQLPALAAADQQKKEISASVAFMGGGDIRLTWDASASVDKMNAPRLKPNQWLMLYRQRPAGGPIEAAWYRILAADDYDPGVTPALPNVGPGIRHLTVQGPDWMPDSMVGGGTQTYAALFDSVVGVYTKTVQLE